MNRALLTLKLTLKDKHTMRNLLSGLLLLFVVLTSSSVQVKAQDGLPTIYGMLRYSNAEYFDFGIYTIDPVHGAAPQVYWADAELMGNGGAVYAGDKYYVLSFMDFGGELFGSYLVCDVMNQTYDYSYPEMDFSYIASDLTYDASNNKVYACSMDASGDGSFWLSSMVLETGAKEPVARMQQMAALAANNEGVLYGIGMDGVLYTIDKNTAALTKVGDTGVLPINDQSATFDPATGALYWSAYTENGSGLYTVDTETGAATLVTEYPNGEQITGLFIMPEEDAEGTPAAIDKLTFDFDKDSLIGKVSFSMPLLDTNGKELNGKLTWSFSIDNGTSMEGEAAPGETIVMDAYITNEGMHQFVAGVKNASGSATPINVERYIGMDTPSVPSDVVAVTEGGSVTVSWTMDDRGAHDGYVDMQQIRYRILRMYDDKVIADALEGNTFTDAFDDGNMHVCRYNIIPYIGGREGVAAVTDDIVVGECMTVPFEHNLANKGDYMLYTTLDANSDKDSWIFGLYPEYSEEMPCATYMWTVTDTNDDWIFTPYIYMEAGKNYEADYSLRAEDNIYAGEVSLMLGTDKTADGMVKTLVDRHTVDYKDFSWLKSPSFTVDESGMYVLGLQVCGARSKYYIYLNGVSVYECQTTGITSSQAQPVVYAGNGVISIDNASAENVSVYDAGGMSILHTSDAHAVLNVEAGLYIVRVGEKVMKVVVK